MGCHCQRRGQAIMPNISQSEHKPSPALPPQNPCPSRMKKPPPGFLTMPALRYRRLQGRAGIIRNSGTAVRVEAIINLASNPISRVRGSTGRVRLRQEPPGRRNVEPRKRYAAVDSTDKRQATTPHIPQSPAKQQPTIVQQKTRPCRTEMRLSQGGAVT